ncbi:MAG: TonB-dependent receptor [Acidobacteriaceae bacterium]|nr:TonB-dependent receptor [Acidobacteriaceae bacterium]MBV9778637.1 TonB-dependent receptor [Acidobacteriaceae bacterium]
MHRVLASVLLVLLCCCVVSAQVGAGGTIVGTITDPSGAAVPNVSIVITNTDTNAVTRVTANQNGEYIAPDLQVGHYTLRAEAPGFKVAEQRDIALNVGDRRPIDLKLEVGSTTETVNVEATAVAVQSESGEVSDVITGQQVTQLATNGRSLYTLTALIPGASSNMSDYQSPTPVGGNSTVSFNGLRQAHNLFMIDGGEDLDRGGSGNISVMPSIDAIGEFRAMTSNYSAEFGLASGATMTMVFKSGTKDFHGELWEFFRNDYLDANNFFLNQAGKPAPELRQNIYGFNFGGPVIIPKVYNRNREKTFFFYNMEWRKIVQGGSINQQVPLTSQYGGNFGSTLGSSLANFHTPCSNQVSPGVAGRFAAAGVPLSVCPAGGTPTYAAWPGNTIPTSLLDPNAQALLSAGIFPGPSILQSANGVTTGNFVGGVGAPTDVREEIARIDHRFSDKFSIFGHWVDEAISQTYSPSQWNSDNLPTSRDVFGNPSYSGVIHATYSISPNILNETAFNYNGNRINIVPIGIISRPSAFNVPELYPGNNLNRIPTIQLSGGESANYDVGSWPWHNKADDYQIRDDVSWLKGSHQLRFGGSWMLYKKIQDLFGNTQGSFSFNGTYTGNGFADFLLGYAASYSELAIQDAGHWDSKSYDAYVQDTWKVTPRLTLNLGVRWDGIPHTYEENNRQSNFYSNLYNPANAAIILPNGTIAPGSPGLGTSPNPILAGHPLYLNGIGIAGQNGIPPGLVKNDWGLFAPRIGFAYDPTGAGKTVLRGGFGIMYERIQGNDVYNAGPNVPFTLNSTLSNVFLSNPTISIATGTAAAAPIAAPSITGMAYTDYKNPASYQYSFGIQQQLSGSTVFSVEYVGNQNRHQNDTRNINLPPDNPALLANIAQGKTQYNSVVPYLGFNSIVLAEDAENSNYNGLQVELRSQLRQDLTVQAAYTWSKALDPATGANGFGNGASGDLAPVSNPYNRAYDYGPSGLDRSHIFVVNFIYQLPFFKNANNLFLKSALGGWELSAYGTMESGLALNVALGGNFGNNGIPNSTNRPDVVGPLGYPSAILQWFNTSAFAPPAPGSWGDAGKGLLRGPGRDNWDVALFKRFAFSESGQRAFELRFETFNTFNHTQFNAVDTTFSNGTFGHVTSVWDPRVLQLAAKLHF